MKILNLWQELDGRKTINTILDINSGPVYEPQPIPDGQLFSVSFLLPRSHLGLAGRLAVPNASRVLIWGHRGFCRAFGPGIHSLRSCPPGRLIGQVVDTSQQSYTLDLNDLRTTDLAKVTLKVSVEFKVKNPWAVVQIKAPVQTLGRILDSQVREAVGKLSHCSLFTTLDPGQIGNRGTLEQEIHWSLQAGTALQGLQILSVKIGKMEGDPQYLDLLAKKVLAEQHLQAEETELQVRQQLASKERELEVFRAETDKMVALAKAERELEDAKRQADIFALEAAQRKFQREMEVLRLDYDLAKARIEALSQAVTPLSNPAHLMVANATYAQGNYTNGRDQALTKVVDNLTAPAANYEPAVANGRARQ